MTAAARVLHAAQPTLSHALGRLERETGTRLFERRPGDRMRPTPAGRLLAARARAALAAVDGFADDVAALGGLTRGELRIAAIQSLNATLLPGPLATFSARYPGIDVRVRTTPAEAVADAIRQGRDEVGSGGGRAARDAGAAGRPAPLPGALRGHRPPRRSAGAAQAGPDGGAARSAAGAGPLRDVHRGGHPQRLRARRLRAARRAHAGLGRRAARGGPGRPRRSPSCPSATSGPAIATCDRCAWSTRSRCATCWRWRPRGDRPRAPRRRSWRSW